MVVCYPPSTLHYQLRQLTLASWLTLCAPMTDKLAEIIAHKRKEIEKIIPLTEKYRVAAAARDDFRSLSGSLMISRIRIPKF